MPEEPSEADSIRAKDNELTEQDPAGQASPAEAPPARSVHEPGEEAPSGAAAATILVVEDDLDVSDSLKVKLEGRGYKVVTTFNGLAALETARELKPDLIILDILLPGLMGYQVCRLLKFDERYRKIPIIMLTGKVDRESREISTKAGADRYITKPFEIEYLLEEVSRYVSKT